MAVCFDTPNPNWRIFPMDKAQVQRIIGQQFKTKIQSQIPTFRPFVESMNHQRMDAQIACGPLRLHY